MLTVATGHNIAAGEAAHHAESLHTRLQTDLSIAFAAMPFESHPNRSLQRAAKEPRLQRWLNWRGQPR